MKIRSILILAGVALAALVPARGDDANSPETRLRDALKNTMLQLRTVTQQRDDLQNQVSDLQGQVDDTTKKLAALTKQAADTQATDARTIATLKASVSDQETSIADLQSKLKDWIKAQNDAARAATDTEANRAKLAALSIHLQRIVDDQKRKNAEMYKLGMELIDRYEKMGLGDAITAKEPFIGITRTKFETLVQDYEDKLTDQLVTNQKAADTKPK
jgi:chromosome segregation ATPase